MSEENRRFHHVRRRRRNLLIALLALMLLGLVTAKPVYHFLKRQRAGHFAAQAEKFVQQGNFNEAAKNYRAALQLDPFGYQPLRGAASLALELNHTEAVDLWQEVIKLREATTADHEEFATALLQNGKLAATERELDRLLKEAPSTTALVLASRYSERIGNSARAIEYARIAVKRAPEEEAARARLAEVLASSTERQERAEARQLLWKSVEKNGAWKRPAIEALARAPELAPDDRQRLRETLRTLSPFTAADAILEADLRLQDDPQNAAAIFEELVAKWSDNATSKVQIAQWLNLRQQPQRVLDLVSADEALLNDQLMLARLDALATQQRWDEIDAILARKDLRFEATIVESFRARSAQGREASLDAELHWNKAIALANGDPVKLRFIATFAEQSGANEIALRAFDQLARSASYALLALAGQQRLAAKAHDVAAAHAVAEKAFALHRDDPKAQNRVIYYNLLLGKDVPANARQASELVKKFPDRLEFRVTAALGFLRQHDAGSALAQFQGPPIAWEKTQPAWRAVYAAVLLANEETARATEMISSIPVDRLAREEAALIQPATTAR